MLPETKTNKLVLRLLDRRVTPTFCVQIPSRRIARCAAAEGPLLHVPSTSPKNANRSPIHHDGTYMDVNNA